MDALWTILGHAWWGLPALLALVAGGFAACGAWPLLVGAVTRLPGQLQAALLALLVGVVAASALYAVGRNHGHDSRDVEVAELQAALTAEREANASNLDTIEKLVAENKAWADAANARTAEAAAAVEAITAERDALAAQLAERRRNRGRIYATDESAAAWGRQPVPSRLADQLRE